jgi:uroporphyrinogen decarboxylase
MRISRKSLASGPIEIDAELDEKVPWMLKRGGYIPYMDHLVPPDVHWDNFKYYRQRLNAMIESTDRAD